MANDTQIQENQQEERAGIKFFNIRSGEVRYAETEPHIAALWSSSDRSPNITQGQDFGWRLAAETVIEIEKIQADERMLEKIAVHFGLVPDSLTESDILTWISEKQDREKRGVSKTQEDFKQQYEEDIRRLRETGQDKSDASIEPEKPPVDQPSGEATPPPQLNTAVATEEPDEEPAPEPQPEPEPESDTPDEEDGVPGPEAVSENMSRAQLETVAKGLGVDAPSSFQSKAKLIEEIRAKQLK